LETFQTHLAGVLEDSQTAILTKVALRVSIATNSPVG
jgi:hypothetical protein